MKMEAMDIRLKTFEGRKELEKQAFKLVCDAFSQRGFIIRPLALDREKVFGHIEDLLSIAIAPPQICFLLNLPDGIAYNPKAKFGFLVEVKATLRDTFSIRCRDFHSLAAWMVLIVVVHLPSEKLYAQLAHHFPAPVKIVAPYFDPDDFFPVWDIAGLEALKRRHPDITVIRAKVKCGSKMPFAVWSLKDLPTLDDFLAKFRILQHQVASPKP